MISIKMFLIFSAVILGGWLLDISSTLLGLTIRHQVPGGYYFLYETNGMFMIFPALWGAAFLILSWILSHNSLPLWFQAPLLSVLAAVSYSPGIRNLIQIWELIQ